MTFTLYLVTNSINGKQYVGQTSRVPSRRMSEHFCHALTRDIEGAFYRAIRKYGREVFSMAVVGTYATREEIIAAEITYIAEHKPAYNSTGGGDGRLFGKISVEGLARISASKKGNTYLLGHKHTDATKELLRERAKENVEVFDRYRALGPAASARKVKCLDDGREWPSASAAARHYEVAKSALIELCGGARNRKTVGGRRFAYMV